MQFDTFEKAKLYFSKTWNSCIFKETIYPYIDFFQIWTITPISLQTKEKEKNQIYYINVSIDKKERELLLGFQYDDKLFLENATLSEYNDFLINIKGFVKHKDFTKYWFNKIIEKKKDDILNNFTEFDTDSLFETNKEMEKERSLKEQFPNRHYIKEDYFKNVLDSEWFSINESTAFKNFLLSITNDSKWNRLILNPPKYFPSYIKYKIRFKEVVDFNWNPLVHKVSTKINWLISTSYKILQEWNFRFFVSTKWDLCFITKWNKRKWYPISYIPLWKIEYIECIDDPSIEPETKVEKIIKLLDRLHPNLNQHIFQTKLEVLKKNQDQCIAFEKQEGRFSLSKSDLLTESNAKELLDLNLYTFSISTYLEEDIKKEIKNIINKPTLLQIGEEKIFSYSREYWKKFVILKRQDFDWKPNIYWIIKVQYSSSSYSYIYHMLTPSICFNNHSDIL